jgi:hypothetical protein
VIVVAEPPIARVIYQDHEKGPYRQDQIRVLISGAPLGSWIMKQATIMSLRR